MCSNSSKAPDVEQAAAKAERISTPSRDYRMRGLAGLTGRCRCCGKSIKKRFKKGPTPVYCDVCREKVKLHKAAEYYASRGKYQKREPRPAKLARRITAGLVRECTVCGCSIVSTGRGRPREYCNPCLGLVSEQHRLDYYYKNRTALLAKLKAKREAERMARGETGGTGTAVE